MGPIFSSKSGSISSPVNYYIKSWLLLIKDIKDTTSHHYQNFFALSKIWVRPRELHSKGRLRQYTWKVTCFVKKRLIIFSILKAADPNQLIQGGQPY